jgi:fused signal recognition particle receptor
MNEGRAGMLTRLFRGGNRVSGSPESAAPDERDAAAKSPAAPTGAAIGPEQRGWFARLRDGLTRSSSALTTGITEVFTRRRLDQAMLDQLEDLLIGADLGPATATEITERLRAERFDRDVDAAEVREFLAREIAARLEPVARPLELLPGARPHVILVVGVNGSGKTTTIGKLAAGFAGDGHKVMLAAGDTFRAAAIDQLAIWGERVGAQVVARDVGADPAGLAFDALQQARAGGADILLIDTAGRLQNKQGLMDELAKIVRVLKKIDPEAPHSVLLVLDATTGQNALSQAEIFRDVADVTGIIMTKLDGTARGGILVAIAEKFALPVHAIGIGEGIDDLGSFEPDDFARAMVGL